MSDVIGSLWDHLNSVRLWIGSALIVIGRLLMETVSAIPVNRWLVRDAKQREHYITEMDGFNIDRCWQWFREGDTICVLLPRDSARAVVKVMARSLSDRQDLMSVSCDVLDWTVL